MSGSGLVHRSWTNIRCVRHEPGDDLDLGSVGLSWRRLEEFWMGGLGILRLEASYIYTCGVRAGPSGWTLNNLKASLCVSVAILVQVIGGTIGHHCFP